MPRKKRCSSPFEIMDDDFDDTSSQSSRNGNPPIRNAANARERARMRVLSSAFGRLKTKLPNIPADTKLSKLDTLRLATMYIKQLKTAVEGGSATSPTAANGEMAEGSVDSSPLNCYLNLNSGAQSMSWPFGFHHHLNSTSSGRSTSSASLINHTTNWCHTDTNNDQLKHVRYENEQYQQLELTQQPQHHPSSYSIQHVTTSSEENIHNQDNHHWYSETPSPELDTSSSMGLSFETSNMHQQTQQQSTHHLSHLQPALTHSSTFHLQHNFQQNHHQHLHQHVHHHQQSDHIQHGFVNSTNFQAASIR